MSLLEEAVANTLRLGQHYADLFQRADLCFVQVDEHRG
jgi:hypothetical protein